MREDAPLALRTSTWTVPAGRSSAGASSGYSVISVPSLKSPRRNCASADVAHSTPIVMRVVSAGLFIMGWWRDLYLRRAVTVVLRRAFRTSRLNHSRGAVRGSRGRRVQVAGSRFAGRRSQCAVRAARSAPRTAQCDIDNVTVTVI